MPIDWSCINSPNYDYQYQSSSTFLKIALDTTYQWKDKGEYHEIKNWSHGIIIWDCDVGYFVLLVFKLVIKFNYLSEPRCTDDKTLAIKHDVQKSMLAQIHFLYILFRLCLDNISDSPVCFIVSGLLWRA